jgi:hypothetical protein
MDTKELLELLTDFLSEHGEYNEFIEWAELKGYDEISEELDKALGSF